MNLIIKFCILCLNIIYSFFKLFKIKNKITFISRQSNNVTVDFKLLKDDLNKRYPNYKVVILCKDLKMGLFGKILYIFHIFRQMYHIATSKVVVLDSYCIPISLLKHKKNLVVIQIWHALGAFKKFGYSIIDKKEGTNPKLIKLMKMHKNYNYIFSSSPKCSKYFAEAFGYNIDKVLSYPLPRLDLLKDKKYIKETNNKILEKYPRLKHKKNILYAPTFRIDKSGIDRKKKSTYKYLNNLINEIDFSKYNLIVKFHPISEEKINDSRVICDNLFNTTDFLDLTDYVITDYSAIVYEASFLNKPLYFYDYDIEEFTKNRDFYLDIKKDMPGLVTDNPKKIINTIVKNKYDIEKIKKFSNDNIVKCNKSYTKDISDFIINNID